ncbi:beta-lactamase family protein [Streptomyces sp. AV19]|uniref:serine hydrolase domain-containing protein n=1 Tax=Streptomyces sp. AV19 TaxID=2793068 RepID=UPI0018FE7A3B|nr:serine hydrolase domain-containing protein [Streptomyces sp. AV19]MBH1935188.1 beta-lactamase family protein [Streptomyces sp. AV19]MDG4532016.1 beta-lactamase family protein [Streptomyces sp. AV19]
MRTGVVRAATVALSSVVLAAMGAVGAVADPARSAAPDAAGVRTALERTVAAGAPGAFAVIRDHDAAPETVTVGKANLDGTPMNADWRFRVGSNTKMFTAALVLRLAEQDRVDLDKPLRTYLPAGTLPEGWDMTVRQVMQHRSGVYDHTNDLLEQAGEETTSAFEKRIRNTVYTPAELVALSVKHGKQFTPGSRYTYSNTNYVLLGMAIEHLTGRSYADVLREQVIEPLGLTETSFVVPDKAIAGPHVTGYLTNDDRSEPLLDSTESNGSWIWSAGAVISSSADLDRFLGALLGGRLLSDASLRQMTSVLPTPTAKIAYGLGLREVSLSCGKVYGHGGIVQGYQTQSFATRDGERTVVVFANASNNGAVTQGLMNTLEPAFCGTPSKSSPRTKRSVTPAPVTPVVPVADDTRI